jgi:hypothetical protein
MNPAIVSLSRSRQDQRADRIGIRQCEGLMSELPGIRHIDLADRFFDLGDEWDSHRELPDPKPDQQRRGPLLTG